ncbi:MAG TPA: CstA-like transporter-associated (seleno)protein [Candidatus Angelobacter sp.]|nr:CstA-like transporter-associated (seleno)protein [Candidatus Angelobacter sp.]
MKQSGDLVIARDLVIGKTDKLFTAEARRREEKSALRWRLQNGWKILRSILREIFDESAYDRFLQRTKTSHSVESYRAFMRERESAAAQKPRCC